MMSHLVMVAFGGAVGASLRWASGMALTAALGRGFPWGTLFVNIAGSLAMGVAAALLMEKAGAWKAWSPFVMTGLLGGFTTFSAFSLDALYLLERGEALKALLYVGGSVILSILALLAGLTLGRGL